MTRFLLAAGLLAAQGMAQVVINEFQYDDSGTDDYEFVELYNGGAVAVDISGWSIVNRDSGSPLYGGIGTDPTHVIPPATILLPGSFYVIGNALVLNVNQVAASNMLENDNESIELRNAANVLQDSVCYEMGLGAFGVPPLAFPLEGNGLYGDLAVNNGPSSTVARLFDGLDTDRNSVDFATCMVATPGAANLQPSALPYFDNFDTGPLLGTVPGWTAGFVGARYVDPTIVDAHNLYAKPASPQGGQAMSIWDFSGGGNALALTSTPVSDVVVDCYAYLEGLMTPINPVFGPTYTAVGVGSTVGTYDFADGESWAIGVRGSMAANANPANPSGTYYTDIALGVGFRPQHLTGIAWVHYRTAGGNTTTATTNPKSQLFLVDFKDGASPANPSNWTVLAGPINIVTGVNDGWQRLRIHVQGNVVVGNFGGTPGLDDGLRVSGTTSTVDAGLVYVGYREALLNNGNCHPVLFDAMDIHVPTTAKSYFGVGSPLSNSIVPVLDADGLAILGSTGFALKGSNLTPGGFAYLALGTNIFPGGFQIPGAPIGANIYFFPFDLEFFQFPDGSGNTNQALPLPSSPAYLGITFAGQIACFDFALSGSLPIGISAPMQMTVGQ